MGKLGDGYGSECHLRRYRGERPADLDAAILATRLGPEARGASIEWLYPTSEKAKEPAGLGFLRTRIDSRHDAALASWKTFWPRGKHASWDGIAIVSGPTLPPTWLLIEAKANHPEFCSPATTAGKGLTQIEGALNKVKSSLGVHRHFCWTGSYYQHANRLAALHVLRQHNIPAVLVDLFFYGDRFPDNRPAPATIAEWESLIEARRLTLGLPVTVEGVVEAFLPVTS